MNKKILIVGAGPTGMVLACILAKNGIKAKIVDKRKSTSKIPRAINISSPVLEILKVLEIDHKIMRGKKLNELKVYLEKKELLNINYKYYKPKNPYFYHVEQSKLEKFLEKKLNSYGVYIERQLSVSGLKNGDENVDVVFSNKNNEIYADKFSYVIGCDGGNSIVRELSGINSTQELYPGHFMLIDGEIDHGYKKNVNKLHYYLSEDGYLIVAPLSKKKCRIIVSFKGYLSGKKYNYQELDDFQKILDARGPGHIQLKKILWNTSGNYFHRIAESAQKSNIFLAGDAMHQFSPIGGANMNVGIQDAYSLGLKLKNAMQDQLVYDSINNYETERLGIAKKYIETTRSMTRLLTGISKTNNARKRFLSLGKDKKLIRYTIPEMFSGEYYS